ncbi:MAG: hypothetical protein R3C16_07965 [Hyphomonadaceae bacterium]
MTAIALGLLALFTIPREEEPQISVPLVDIMVRADGLRAPDAVELVTKPLETIIRASTVSSTSTARRKTMPSW